MYNYVMYHRLIIFYNDAFACSRTMKVYRCFFLSENVLLFPKRFRYDFPD